MHLASWGRTLARRPIAHCSHLTDAKKMRTHAHGINTHTHLLLITQISLTYHTNIFYIAHKYLLQIALVAEMQFHLVFVKSHLHLLRERSLLSTLGAAAAARACDSTPRAWFSSASIETFDGAGAVGAAAGLGLDSECEGLSSS